MATLRGRIRGPELEVGFVVGPARNLRPRATWRKAPDRGAFIDWLFGALTVALRPAVDADAPATTPAP